MSEMGLTERDAKRATVDVSVAIKNLNQAIRSASEFGVEVIIYSTVKHVGARGSRSTLVKGDFKLVLNGLDDHGDGGG